MYHLFIEILNLIGKISEFWALSLAVDSSCRSFVKSVSEEVRQCEWCRRSKTSLSLPKSDQFQLDLYFCSICISHGQDYHISLFSEEVRQCEWWRRSKTSFSSQKWPEWPSTTNTNWQRASPLHFILQLLKEKLMCRHSYIYNYL